MPEDDAADVSRAARFLARHPLFSDLALPVVPNILSRLLEVVLGRLSHDLRDASWVELLPVGGLCTAAATVTAFALHVASRASGRRDRTLALATGLVTAIPVLLIARKGTVGIADHALSVAFLVIAALLLHRLRGDRPAFDAWQQQLQAKQRQPSGRRCGVALATVAILVLVVGASAGFFAGRRSVQVSSGAPSCQHEDVRTRILQEVGDHRGRRLAATYGRLSESHCPVPNDGWKFESPGKMVRLLFNGPGGGRIALVASQTGEVTVVDDEQFLEPIQQALKAGAVRISMAYSDGTTTVAVFTFPDLRCDVAYKLDSESPLLSLKGPTSEKILSIWIGQRQIADMEAHHTRVGELHVLRFEGVEATIESSQGTLLITPPALDPGDVTICPEASSLSELQPPPKDRR